MILIKITVFKWVFSYGFNFPFFSLIEDGNPWLLLLWVTVSFVCVFGDSSLFKKIYCQWKESN